MQVDPRAVDEGVVPRWDEQSGVEGETEKGIEIKKKREQRVKDGRR